MDQSGTFYEYVAADSRVLRISPMFEKLTAASVREACGLYATSVNANNQTASRYHYNPMAWTCLCQWGRFKVIDEWHYWSTYWNRYYHHTYYT